MIFFMIDLFPIFWGISAVRLYSHRLQCWLYTHRK